MVDPVGENLGYFFRGVARSVPERTALIDLAGGEERILSYATLDRRMERVAGALAMLGLVAGDRVALIAGNRSEYVESFFGAMRAGVVPVPLNARQTRSALDFTLRDAGCVGAIVDPEACPEGCDLVDSLGLAARVALAAAPPAGWTSYEAALADAPADATPAISPDGIAFQPYTAGSTGRPKGVRLTHQGMLWSIETSQRHWPVEADAVGLVAVPLFHKNAMRGTIKPVLYAGAKAVIMPRFEPQAFLEALARYRVTFTGGVPAVFAMLLRHRELIRALDLSALKSFSIGSAVVPAELFDALEREFAGVQMKEAYGLTEAGGPLRLPRDRPTPRGSCGVVGEGYEVKLVAADGRECVAMGELWTRNPCVTAGYHNLPEVTREKIADGWLKTGDMFRVDDQGFYYFLGRIDDMFSCGGENIYPKEVENLLFGHAAVRDACVVAIPHPVKGFAPGAAVVLAAGAAATPEDLKRFCLEHGPAYAHPRQIVIVDEIPQLGAGKHDRRSIQRLLAAALPAESF